MRKLEGQKCPPHVYSFPEKTRTGEPHCPLTDVYVLMEDGTPNDFHLVHLGGRAVGGAGLLMTEMTNVTREGRITWMYRHVQTGTCDRLAAYH